MSMRSSQASAGPTGPSEGLCRGGLNIKSWQRPQSASSMPSYDEQLLRAFCILLETMMFIMSITARHLCRETNNETQQLKSKAGLTASLPPCSSLKASLLSTS